MSVNTIDLGAAPNDHTGTPARSAGQIINDNFIYLDGKISNKNQIVTYGTFALVGQVLTIHAGWVWLINGQQFTNPVDVDITYPFAASGKQRLDRVVFNTSNTFSRIAGPESETNPFAPALLPDTIEFGVNLVTDNSVGDPSSPVIGDNYVEKLESQDFVVSGSAIVEQINLIDNRSSVSITGVVADIKSIQLSVEFIRPGKTFVLKNRTSQNVFIWHNSGSGNLKFSLPKSVNLIIKPDEIIEFNLNANDSANYKLEYVGFPNYKTIIPNSSISYTFKLSDVYRGLIEHTSSSAITETIPNNSTVPFPVGSVIESVATGTGIRTTAGAAGVIIKTNLSTSSVQNEIRRFIKIDTNTWLIEGNIKKVNEIFIIRDSHYSSALPNSNWFFKVYTNALVSTDSVTTDLLTAVSATSSTNYMSIFEAPYNCEIVSITVSIENDWAYTGSFGFAKHRKKQSAGAAVPTNVEIVHEFSFNKGSYSQFYKKVTAADFGLKTISEGESFIWGWKGEIRFAKILVEFKKV